MIGNDECITNHRLYRFKQNFIEFGTGKFRFLYYFLVSEIRSFPKPETASRAAAETELQPTAHQRAKSVRKYISEKMHFSAK